MVALKLSGYEVWLLISGDALYPFSSHGFKFAQGSPGSVPNVHLITSS